MKPYDVSALFAAQIDQLSQHKDTPSLWQQELQNALTAVMTDTVDTDDLIALMQTVSRLSDIYAAGLENDADFLRALKEQDIPTWQTYSAPPVADDLQHSLADKIYNADPSNKNEVVMVNLGDGARVIGRRVIEKCIADKVNFIINFQDMNFSTLLMNHSDMDGVEKVANKFLAITETMTKSISARPGLPEKEPLAPNDKDKVQLQKKLMKSYGDRVLAGKIFFTLTVVPTKKDAEVDGMDYKDYIKLFFEMCDQPWDLIDKAHKALISELNDAKTLRFTNSDGTDVSMDIDGFTFCNSLIAKNVPGSEVFSAPRRDSVNGTIVAKGRFSPPRDNGDIIENLTMVFNKGRLVEYKADKGYEIFDRIVKTDEGASFIGEVGIGTNPHLKKHVCNGLLVEKIGGSFHLALGGCYTLTDYMGVPVKVDNGNTSAIHWDITTMLHGKNGRIYVDGRMIMDDGKFIDPKYDVLNRGWASVEESERPAYWQDYYKKNAAPGAKP